VDGLSCHVAARESARARCLPTLHSYSTSWEEDQGPRSARAPLLFHLNQEDDNMIRLHRRLQVYALACILIGLTTWCLVPHTRSQHVQLNQRTRRRLQPPSDMAWTGDLEALKSVFKKTDTTADGLLSLKELTWGISKSVEKHLQSAMRNNFKKFFRLDKINHNGQVEWDEWLRQFYKDNNLSSDLDLKTASRTIKEKMAAAKAAWSEAARSNPDAINIDEFLSFSHPEVSRSILAQQTEELLGRFDADDNGLISLDEYLDDPFMELNADEKSTHTRQFTDDMDADADGNIDRRELLSYLDPKHPSHAKEEAQRLLELADENQDGLLSWDELRQQIHDFYQSKWISPERAFHGDL
jgi:Ca2+-binding EF-hand superfamily protein